MDQKTILKSYGTDYKEMTKRLLRAADIICDIPSKGSRIGIKPNLVTPTPASYGATTHPEVVAGIIEFLNENGFYNIAIAEGSWVGDKTEEAFRYCGYEELKEKYNVDLIDTQKDGSYKVRFNDIEINVNNCVKDFDYLINVPVLKGHCQTKVTCALKNMKGLIPNSEKRRFHTIGLHKPIAYLNKCIKQDLIVIDHICGDPDFEEGGNPLVKNCIMVAKDAVLADAYACRILGLKPLDVEYIRIADALGIGSSDLSLLKIQTVTEDGSVLNESNPENNCISYEQAGEKILDVSYAVDEINSCSACYGTLIPALSRLKDEGLLDKLDCRISIGQGHRGKTGKLGVGDCTSCFETNIKGCPPSEEDILNGLRDYLLKNPFQA